MVDIITDAINHGVSKRDYIGFSVVVIFHNGEFTLTGLFMDCIVQSNRPMDEDEIRSLIKIWHYMIGEYRESKPNSG